MAEQFCTLCEQFIAIDEETIILDRRDGNHRTLIVADGRAHTVLSEKASATRQKKAQQESKVVYVYPPVPAAPPLEPSNPATEVEVLDLDHVPLFESWYTVRVRQIITSRKGMPVACLADLDSGERVHIFFNTVERAEGHQCLYEDDQVAVRLELNDHPSTTVTWKAIETINQTPHTHLEHPQGELIEWHQTGKRGLVLLDCGCIRRVQKQGPPEFFDVGNRVEVGQIEEDITSPGNYIARNIWLVDEIGDEVYE